MGIYSRAADDERSGRALAGAGGAGTGGDAATDALVEEWAFDDPEFVKVHYDLRSWNLDARGELIAALAEAGVMHRWEGEEVVVLETAESIVDDIVDRLDDELGPFAVVLDGPGVEFALDDLAERDLRIMAAALIEAGIAHRWEGSTVVVELADADDVDDLVEAVEHGDIAIEPGGSDPAGETADTVLSDLFSIADRLARDPTDTAARRRLDALVETIDEDQPPFGITLRSWSVIADAAEAVVDAFEEYDADTVEAAADRLRSVLRPFV